MNATPVLRRIPAAFYMHPSSAAWPQAKLRLDLDELNAVSGSRVAVGQHEPRRWSLQFQAGAGSDRYAIDLKIESFGIGLGLASRRFGLARPAKRRSRQLTYSIPWCWPLRRGILA